MMMIAFITIKSSLVPLIEGLYAVYVYVLAYKYIYILLPWHTATHYTTLQYIATH